MSKPRFDLVIGEEALLMKSCLFSSIKVIHMQWLDDQIPLVRTFRPKVDPVRAFLLKFVISSAPVKLHWFECTRGNKKRVCFSQR